MSVVLVYWTIQLYCLLYKKVYKSFEPAYLCLSLIGAYYCVGLYCLITKIRKHKNLLTYQYRITKDWLP